MRLSIVLAKAWPFPNCPSNQKVNSFCEGWSCAQARPTRNVVADNIRKRSEAPCASVNLRRIRVCRVPSLRSGARRSTSSVLESLRSRGAILLKKLGTIVFATTITSSGFSALAANENRLATSIAPPFGLFICRSPNCNLAANKTTRDGRDRWSGISRRNEWVSR